MGVKRPVPAAGHSCSCGDLLLPLEGATQAEEHFTLSHHEEEPGARAHATNCKGARVGEWDGGAHTHSPGGDRGAQAAKEGSFMNALLRVYQL